MKVRRPLFAGAIALLTGSIAASCGGASSSQKTYTLPDVGKATAALIRANSCDELLTQIQTDMLVHLEQQAEVLMDPDSYYYYGVRGGGVTTDFDDGAVSGGAEPPTSNSGGGDSKQGGEGPSGYSQTNTQVAGVDEADIVKTNGEDIYLLHGSELVILDSWPPEDLSQESATTIEGEPAEMFVSGDTALVFSHIYGELGSNSGDNYDYRGFTKVTALDVSGSKPSVLREHYIEGDYLSARLNDSIARVVVRDGFRAPEFDANIDYYDPWGNEYSKSEIALQVDAWKERAARSIEQSDLSDWLPREYTMEDGELTAVAPRCKDHYSPAPGLVLPGVTSIVSFDVNDIRGALSGATILGDAEEIYANHEVLLLSHADYRFMTQDRDSEQTALHQFELDGATTPYVASGFIPGHIHDQFSLDERDGIVRVATTQNRWNSSGTDFQGPVNGVYTLSLNGEELETVGKVEDLAPGEQIFSTRFVGDRGYVVTFRQMDPLFVIDLSDPEKLEVLAEVKIPGFSDYMHPLGDTHLLTIGRDADENGRDLALALQIFDVSDATNPKQTHKFVFEENGYSEANVEHKAFTYYADKKLLGFPFVSYDNGFSTSFEVFSVDTKTGFEQLGSIDHTPLLVDNCETYEYQEGDQVFTEVYCPFNNEVRRGLFIDDYVYSISYGGVLAHELSDLEHAVAQMTLPPPEIKYGGGGGVAEPGFAGTPDDVAADEAAEAAAADAGAGQ